MQDLYNGHDDFLVEWSADCNGDGIVDYGQILDGSLVDDNDNGVPDSCELDHVVPDHYPSIQAAIDQTEPGTVIQVRSGTYLENIISNSPIILRSLDGPEATIIDGSQSGTVVQLAGGQPHAIDGFTVTNGVGPANTAGGILISGGTHLAIRNCIISDNTHVDGEYGGGGLKLDAGTLQMNNCEFRGNSSSWNGGAVYIWHSCCVYITDCTFTNHVDGGSEYGPLDVVHMQNDSTASISGCVFDGNRFRDSEIVVWDGANATVTNCEFLNGQQTEPTQPGKPGSVFSGAASSLAIGSNYACEHPEPHVTIDFTDLGGNDFTDEPCDTVIDCNLNGIEDADDIADGTSQDCNTNGIPDECDIDEGLEEDCNGDGVPDSCQTYNDESTWTNAAGGDLLDPANWSDCQEPDATSDLFFILPDAYTVTCPDTEVGSASVLDGTVTLALEGTLELGDAGDTQGLLVEGEGDEPMATLLVTSNTSGELLCTEVTIAGSESSFGALTLQGGDTSMELPDLPSRINVGTGGTGYLSVLNGATVTTGHVSLGHYQGLASGMMEIGDDALVDVSIQLTIEQSSEATLVDSGTIAGNGNVLVNAGGRLSGNGAIEADVTNFGGVEATPGEPLRILGDYEQRAPATLNFSGTFAASIQGVQTWGAIQSTDDVELGGLLDLTVDPAYIPAQGTQWPVLTAGTGITGAFDIALITGLPDDMYADIVYSNALRGGDEETVTVVFGSLENPLGFDPPTPVTLDSPPAAMLVQDLDGDGADELIIAIPGDPDGTVLIYPNESGEFADEPIVLNVGPDPAALVAGDFTGDGEIEIACANTGNNSITIIRYPMDSSMEIATLLTDGGVPVGLAAGNFLDDGASDELAVACTGTDTIEFWQHGAGLRTLEFSRSVIVDLDDTPGGIDPGRVNEDKDAFVPLAVTLPGEGGIVVLDNDGAGDFSIGDTYPAGENPSQVRVASLDGQATTPNDLVVLNRDDGTISILLDLGNAQYLPAANLSVGQNPDSIDLADLDADGDQDIVLVAINSVTGQSTVLLLRNDFVPTGQLVFAPATSVDLPEGTIPLLVGDGIVDLDIYPDLVTINGGGAGFRSGSLPSFSTARNGLCGLSDCAGDLDADGLVGIDDLLALLDGFGTSDGDVDCDGISNINDLLVLIGNWGPCN